MGDKGQVGLNMSGARTPSQAKEGRLQNTEDPSIEMKSAQRSIIPSSS